MPLLRLDVIHDETPEVRVFHFSAPDGGAVPAWSPGAHVEFDLGPAGSRAYSLIPDPDAGPGGSCCVAVKREDSGQGGSRAMHGLSIGETVEISLPANDFPLDEGDRPVLLLAGGIGVTPMISMAAALLQQGRSFEMHYSGRTRAAMAFTDRLSQMLEGRLFVYTDDENPLDLPALLAMQRSETSLYVCGPQGMIEAARNAADTAGLTDVHVELFTSPEPQSGDTAFEVETGDGQVFVIPPGRSIIEVLEDAGFDLMYDCQRGDCGICQCDVLSGTPDHRDVVLSADEKASGKVMQICVSRAKSARLVLDI